MKVEVELQSGFCFGVENAISIAEESLISGETVYCLGSIVHNEQEVTRLQKLGLRTIDHSQMKVLKDCKLLIRAHGEPPSTYEIARENSIEIIEATCPIVRKLQTRIKNAWKQSLESEAQIVIFGREGHAEVVGLLGQAENSLLLRDESDIDKLDFTRPVIIFSQTTRSKEKYDEITVKIRERFEKNGLDASDMVKVNKTICWQVANREPSLIEFSRKHDTMIFVSGKESSNGKMLYEVCRSVNKNSYFISSPDEISPEWFSPVGSVGISGATSTPKWLINEVFIKIKLIGESQL